MRFRKKLLKKRLDFAKFNPENDDTEEWLGKELVEEGNKLLNNCPDRDDLIVRFLIAKKNWNLAMQEIADLEEKNRKLEVQIQILRRD